MGKPVTHTILILDQSGSMEGTITQTVEGFNEKLQQAKIASSAKDEAGNQLQEVYVSLITFNGDVFEHTWCKPAEELSSATVEDYQCGGSTAMRDAIGYTIEKLLATTDCRNEDVSYFLEIISDGKDNASKYFNRERLSALTSKVEETKRWTFTYMGHSKEDVRRVATENNIPLSNCAAWSNKTAPMARRGMVGSSTASAGYYAERAKGVKCATNLHCLAENDCADFSQEDSVDVPMAPQINLWKPPSVVNMVVNSNHLDDSPANINILNSTTTIGSSPFSNYQPVKFTNPVQTS